MSKKKTEGKVYTPEYVVIKMLNEINYDSVAILNKFIADPGCGEGVFTIEIVKRILYYSKKEDLANNLSKVYACDIDEKSVDITIKKLNDLIKPYNIVIKWNIFVGDALKDNIFPLKTFDYVVGNPPYVRIQNLEENYREYIINNYNFCKFGSTDIFYAFIEMADKLLNDNGICCYITPNSWISSVTGKNLREFFISNRNLIKIINLNSIRIFENASTYTSINIFNKKSSDSFKYVVYQDFKLELCEERDMTFSELNSNFWNFHDVIKNDHKKLKDVVKIRSGIATLLDKVFIGKLMESDGNYFTINFKNFGNVKIEKDILRPIIKASKYGSSNLPISEYIIFPYILENSKANIINEDFFKDNYPNCYNYLLERKLELSRRDKGKREYVKWYAYGRTQSFLSYGKKIIFSPMNIKPNFVECVFEDAMIYSGYYMIVNDDNKRKKLMDILNSDDFYDFIKNNGRDFQHGWKSYNKSVIQEYELDI